jgi:hypothetical protein
MKNDHSPSNHRKQASATILLALVISIVWGCTGQYGHLRQDNEVTRMFATNSVPENYHYYIDGRSDMPYAIVGIIPEYRLVSRFWEPVEPNTEDFARKVAFIWRPRGLAHYTTGMGSYIHDPQDKKIGIWYSMHSSTTVKFREGNQVEVYSPNFRMRD